MAFFGDLFNAVTGQKKLAPYNELSVEDALNQSVPLSANATVKYNDILQPAFARQGLASSNQVNPYANELEKATTKSILDQLNLGGELPAEVQAAVQRNALQSGVASGLGISPAGRTVVARDLGLTGLDLLNQRIGRAAQFTPVATSTAARFFNPQIAFTPGQVAEGLQGQNEARNAREAEKFYNDKSNFLNLLNTGGRVLGGVAGGIFGGPMGASLGSSIGGSLIQNPYQGNAGGGGSPFASLLNLGGGGGGGGMGGSNLLAKLFGSPGGVATPGISGQVPPSLTAGTVPFNGFFL